MFFLNSTEGILSIRDHITRIPQQLAPALSLSGAVASHLDAGFRTTGSYRHPPPLLVRTLAFGPSSNVDPVPLRSVRTSQPVSGRARREDGPLYPVRGRVDAARPPLG